MASICKGICVRHKALGAASFGRYLRGQKRCQSCQIFLEWHGGWCPCCGTKLRTRSRNWKYRSKSKVKGTESNTSMTYVMIYSPFDDVRLSSLKNINLTRRECKSYDKNELG
ncbi:MAG: hypothetical protein WB975_08140 [Nitrososphaeraceae archaeon]